MTVPETLENLVAASPLIVEGKVRSQKSLWDVENKNIYTVNEIEVFKIFQGITTINTVHVVTRGGVVVTEGADVELEMDRVSNALELEVGEMGMFMLQAFPGDLPTAEILHRPTEGVLGFIRYDLVIGAAQGVYDNYSDITTELYGKVTLITGLSNIIGPWYTEDIELSGKSSVEQSIVSNNGGSSNANFEVHAGVGDELTITGTDFGAEPGSVLFPDANSGGSRYISALPNQIKEWSDDRIVLEVPYRAGTGKVRIDKASGESFIGEDNLPIGYDHINVEFTDDTGRKAYETQLTSDNGKGGYDFQFESDFAKNTGASQAFISLIETWACTTGVNFQIGEVTNVDEDANDGINVVRFDNGDELGGRTLAYARSRYRGCYQEETIKWFVNEIEVVVNDDYDWYYGDGLPGDSQFDFETVMLHEIGHTTQLGHVINANEVMHFAVGPRQQKRSLSFIDTIGGEFVTDKSTKEAVCDRNLMDHFGGCCEMMAVVNQPSDKTLCPDDATAIFEFEIDFADSWLWQAKNGEVWIDLDHDATYSGADTAKLTVSGSDKELSEFRCIAGNACNESLTSETAYLSARDMNFSLTTLQATCDTDGQITLERTMAEGAFSVSTNGGTSYDTVWSANEYEITISVSSGSYAIVVVDDETGCSVDLVTVVIHEPVAFPKAKVEIIHADCEGANGAFLFALEPHPDYDQVEVSLDGGSSYRYSFDAASEENEITGLSAATYTIWARWAGSSCDHSLGSFSIPKEMSENANCSDMTDEAADAPDTPNIPEEKDNPETPDTPDALDIPEENDTPQTTDTEEISDISLKLYPNPTHERIYIRSNSVEILRLQLFSARGALVQDVVPHRENEDTFFMDVAHPQAGVYALHIITLKKNILRQVIIK